MVIVLALRDQWMARLSSVSPGLGHPLLWELAAILATEPMYLDGMFVVTDALREAADHHADQGMIAGAGELYALWAVVVAEVDRRSSLPGESTLRGFPRGFPRRLKNGKKWLISARNSCF